MGERHSRRAPRHGDERGTTTFWMLGLCLMVLFLGGISLDLWRAFGARHTTAGEADAAAIAGASGIDEAYFRATGEVRLDPDLARSLAIEHLRARADAAQLSRVDVNVDGNRISVTLEREVDLTLLRLFGGRTVTVRATGTAAPQRSP